MTLISKGILKQFSHLRTILWAINGERWSRYVLGSGCSVYRIQVNPDQEMLRQNCAGNRIQKSGIGRLLPIITTAQTIFMCCGWIREWCTLVLISRPLKMTSRKPRNRNSSIYAASCACNLESDYWISGVAGADW